MINNNYYLQYYLNSDSTLNDIFGRIKHEVMIFTLKKSI